MCLSFLASLIIDRFLLSIAEGIATLLIAIFWRIISFKYTHLVERMGLLTLILIGGKWSLESSLTSVADVKF